MEQDAESVFSAMGARLAAARKEIGLSQVAMAGAIGVSPRSYHAYERGHRSLPVEALVAISDLFDVDTVWILLGTKTDRAAHDFEAVKKIVSSLTQHLKDRGIKIDSEKFGQIVARWYQNHVEGRETRDYDVHVWIELARS